MQISGTKGAVHLGPYKYDACVGDVVNIDVIFCKFADSCRFKCVG